LREIGARPCRIFDMTFFEKALFVDLPTDHGVSGVVEHLADNFPADARIAALDLRYRRHCILVKE
jgi:hypothetical protein